MSVKDEFDVPVETPAVEVKLFGKWSSDEVHVNDISLAVRCFTLLSTLLLNEYSV